MAHQFHTRARCRKSLEKFLRLSLCLALLFQSLVISTVRSAAAGVKKGKTPAVAQNRAVSLQGTPATVAASAVVNFSQLAAQDAAKPTPVGPPVPQVIHSPVTPPEVDAPPPGKGQTTPAPAVATPSPAVASPSPSSSFIGMTDIPKTGTSNIVIPPDTTGAIGLTDIFATVNNNYVVQNKTTGALSAPVSMDTFWSSLVGVSGVFDPRTVYDPYNSRWIVSAVSNSVSANSSILVGVSQTSNPGGTYFLFRVDADSANVDWADFPCMGFNKNWVAINVNMIRFSGGGTPLNKALVINYPSLRTNVFSGTLFSGTGTCAFPVTTYSPTENTLYVTTHLSSAGATYSLDTITGTPAAPAYALGASKTRTGGGWTQPTPGGQILPQSAPVAGTSSCGATPCKLETQDSFVRSEPVFRNSNIYYAQTIGLPAGGTLTRTAVQWTKIDTSGNFVDGGRVDDPTATATNGGKWYAYVSLSVNQNNDVLLGFSQFASNQHPSAGYTFRFAADAAGTMRDPFIYKTGEDYYNKTFGGGRNRYGDYSMTQVDPSNDVDLWTLQEYAMLRTGTDDGNTGSNSSKWSTWWAKIGLAPTFAKIRAFTATELADGRVMLQWKSEYEVANLGYNLYREVGNQRTKINPQIVAGSAFVAGANIALTAGKNYAWADQPQSKNVSYWLEEIDLSGRATFHGPISPTPGALSDQALAPLLDKLASGAADYSVQQEISTRANRPGSSPARPTIASLETQWQIASQPAVKIQVRKDGWYRVRQSELIAVGLDTSRDPRFLQLFVDGQEVPMIVNGAADGRFDPQDSIEFYGAGLDTASTDLRTYWLVYGSQLGRRVNILPNKGGSPGGALSFTTTVERKDRSIYFAALKNGDADNFFGPIISSTTTDQTILLGQVDQESASPAKIEIGLQGVTNLPESPDHSIRVLLNGISVGSINFEGQSHHVATLPISNRELQQGSNVVSLVAEGGQNDMSLLDYIRVTYSRQFKADNNVLRFTTNSPEAYRITGFTDPAVRVLDITDANAAQELTPVIESQAGSFVAKVTPPDKAERLLIAFADRQAERPAFVTANEPSSWNSKDQGADLVIISNRNFISSLAPLVALRRSQGYAVSVIKVEDLFDEFSFGAPGPQAIRDFLARAKSMWKRPPGFVLLVGDASLDPRNYLNLGAWDLVPTKLVDTAFLETASDDWMADLNDDSIPDLAVGRLPVRTPEQTDIIVSKIIAYTRADRAEGVVMVADRNDSFSFEAENNNLRSLIPEGTPVQEILRGQLDDQSANTQIIDAINRSPRLVNYLGHGSVSLWRGNLLTGQDAAALANEQGTVFLMMTCLNAFFQDVYEDSLAESLMKAEHGAVAVWASSALTMPQGQSLMNREIYRQIFGSQSVTIGEAAMRAKSATSDGDLRRSWILFGDPMMKLR